MQLSRDLLSLAFWFATTSALDASRFLYYSASADEFEAALPVGNGRIGGHVYGQPTEFVQLNENSFWSGLFQDRVNPDAIDNWKNIRQELVDGDLSQGNDDALQYMVSIPEEMQSYQPLVDLYVDVGHSNSTLSGYERWLDTTTGVAGIQYSVNNISYTYVLSMDLQCDVAS
jgi:hypothetical protein